MKLSNISLFESPSLETNANHTNRPIPDITVDWLIAQQTQAAPDAIALIDQGRQYSYRELDRESNRIAAFLLERKVGATPVAVLAERSFALVTALLGIMRAGAIYTPLNPAFPFRRQQVMLRQTAAPILLCSRQQAHLAQTHLWECPELTAILCLDSDDLDSEVEPPKLRMAEGLWDHIAETADDAISGGGWRSAITGEWLSEWVMQDYANNVRAKLAPHLMPDSRVLEIGCGSGLTLFALAPLVGSYFATDLSAAMIGTAAAGAQQRGLDQIRFLHLAAHELKNLGENEFNTVILNSVVQSFNGYGYLRQVIAEALALCANEAVVFLGHLWDASKRDAYAATGANAEGEDALFVAREFLLDLAHEFPEIAEVEITPMTARAENELTAYSFDCVLHVRRQQRAAQPLGPRRRLRLDRRALESYANAPAVHTARPQGTAYIIFTSGSTGTPKGVVNSMRSLVNLCNWYIEFCALAPGERVYQVIASSFDASIKNYLAPLVAGATIVMYPEAIYDPALMLDILHREKVSVLNPGVPSQFYPLVELAAAGGYEKLSSLRVLALGGEKPDLGRLRTWLRSPACRLSNFANIYGPTECADISTAGVWRPEELLNAATLPIGRPIYNAHCYILDSTGRPLPAGAVGELCIAGAGVGIGYIGNEMLSAQQFVADPFIAGGRMYRTGDLAWRREDGQIELMGRRDDEVKIRGHRMTLGEIETHLRALPGVHDAAAVCRTVAAEQQLLAFVTGNNIPDDRRLTALLANELPAAMVPSRFVRVGELPRNAHGKLDRTALPAPDKKAFSHQTYEAPQGEVETTLAAIWTELLGVEHISRHDSFFAVGGHSLLAVRLMNRVATLGAELPLTTLFASPSLSAFAAAVNERLTHGDCVLPAITLVSRDGTLPLSFAQQRLWFLAQLDGVSHTYHMPMAIRLRGTLDRAAWQCALNSLFARHEALRSVFVTVDGQPQVQLLAAESGLPMRLHDLRGDPNANAKLASLSAEETHTPFDLAHGPMVRACLIQLSDEEYVFLLTQHHIVSDGWSFGVLLQELNTLYTAYRAGKPDPMPPLAIQYPDYAAWQRQWFSGEQLQAHSDYWRSTLVNAPVLLELPTDRPRPSQQSFIGAQVPVHLDAQMTHALKRLSQEHSITLFMIILAAWSTVLSRLSGQDDLIIGTPSANRNHPEIEPLIGFFVNTLALRIDLSGAPNTSQLFERVRRNILDAQIHQDLPFEQVVEIVRPPRKLDHTPLFQAMLIWQNDKVGEWRLPALEVTPVVLSDDTIAFDLELDLQEMGDEITGKLRYATALFDQQTIERQVGYLHAILRAMVDDAKQSVSTVNLLAPAERTLLLQTWNETAAPYPKHLCLHQLFEEQVERTPETPALVYEDQVLSYADLNARANRLAHQLIELGVQPDTRVAICMERSPAMVVGLLAILKAGGAYVPLDPAYPSKRLAYILTDAAPAILLADATGRDALGKTALALLTMLDPNVLLSAQRKTNPHVPELTSNHLAYVIYTSGSTGMPKGVMVEHRNVVNLLMAMSLSPGISNHDRLLTVTSISFDIAGLELYLPMHHGATIIIASRRDVADPARLQNIIIEQKISLMQATPSVWRALLDLPEPRLDLTALCGGEALQPSLSVRLRHATRGLWNMYGPTETTIWSSISQVSDHQDSDLSSISIGRPIANTQIYLLDAHSQPVPLGAAGELYIGGTGVARGYLNRPELTAERFLRDPFSDLKDARMYKTGDLARYLPDGNLLFLGRNDHQLKIRGFRIEPGEIEARLVEHPQVREATVLALGQDSAKRLIAYIVAEPDEQLVHTLRSHLSTRLPEYMMPAAFVRLDALPLTPNGKLDRRALPAPDDEAFARQTYEAPQGEDEATLAAIWTELLGVEHIGRHDSFFALGGHSLLAVQMISCIRTTLGVEIALRTLFNAPTIAGLAQSLLKLEGIQDDSFDVLLPIQPKGTRPPLFCVHPAAGLSWSYIGLVKHLGMNQPIYGLQARGLNGVGALAETIDAMASDYIRQIRRIQPNGPYYLLGWSFGGHLAHSIATRFEQQGEKVALLALLDSYPDCSQLANEPAMNLENDYIDFFAHYSDKNIPNAGEYLWEKTRDAIKNNVHLLKSFSPLIYCGDVLFFRATIRRDEFPPVPCPDSWKPYVLGNIENHDVHCKHKDMDRPAPIAEIGRILAQKLGELMKHRPPQSKEKFLA